MQKEAQILPKIVIKEDGFSESEIYINDKKIDGIESYSIQHTGGELPILQLNFVAMHMELETKAVPSLPDALKPFYKPVD